MIDSKGDGQVTYPDLVKAIKECKEVVDRVQSATTAYTRGTTAYESLHGPWVRGAARPSPRFAPRDDFSPCAVAHILRPLPPPWISPGAPPPSSSADADVLHRLRAYIAAHGTTVDGVFAKFDRDGSGALDYRELKLMLHELMPELSIDAQRHVMAQIAHFDTDGDGQVGRPDQ